jgi:trk system potassium uptake protein TrkA
VHVIVVGCGRVGSQLATLLSTEGHDVVVIDKNPDAFRRLGSTFNGITLAGYGYDEEVLGEAGIDRCDAFAAVTDFDNANMMAAEVASKLHGVARVVARLYNPERERTFQQLGLDYVCGTTMVAQAMLDKLITGHGHHLTIRGDIELIEFIAGPKVDNKMVVDIQIPNEFRICLVTREGTSFVPWRETILKDRDILLCVVKDTAYERVKQFMRDTKEL